MIADAHDTNLLAAYFEGRVSEAERAQLVAHLAGCRQCRDTLAAFARASAADSPQERYPATLPVRPRSWQPKFWMPVAAGLAAAAIAATLVRRSNPIEEARPHPPAAEAPAPVSSSPDVAPPPPSAGASAPTPSAVSPPTDRPERGADRSLLARRGAERQVGSKTFRLEAGEWVDTAYDPVTAGPVIEATGSDERAAVLARVPALAPYAALGDRVTVVFEGSVYRFGAAPGR